MTIGILSILAQPVPTENLTTPLGSSECNVIQIMCAGVLKHAWQKERRSSLALLHLIGVDTDTPAAFEGIQSERIKRRARIDDAVRRPQGMQ